MFAHLNSSSEGVGAIDWDKFAKMYDGMIRLERASTLKQIAELPITKEDSVADIGCGPGRLSVPIAKIAKSVTSVDAFGQMLKYAKQNAKNEGVKNIKFIQKNWLDEDALNVIGRHDVVIASRSVGLKDIKRLNQIATKYACLICFLPDFLSLRDIHLDLLDGITERPKRPNIRSDRMFGYNVTFNMLYDMGANVNVRIMDDVYEMKFDSLDEAFEHFKFIDEIPAQKEKIYRKNVQKYLMKDGSGYKFHRATKSYVMWWRTDEIT